MKNKFQRDEYGQRWKNMDDKTSLLGGSVKRAVKFSQPKTTDFDDLTNFIFWSVGLLNEGLLNEGPGPGLLVRKSGQI